MFIVVDGLDGTGKGVVIDEVIKTFENIRIFDLHKYWEHHNEHPDFEQRDGNKNYVSLDSFDVMVSSEPTYVGIGKHVRHEITSNNNRKYSSLFTSQMFSADREVLYKRVHLPALSAGKTIIQSRSVSTSIVYQPMQSKENSEIGDIVTMEDILSFSGNDLALQYAPDLLIIPTISNPEELMKRLDGRDKKDNSIFETLDFQMKLKPHYESELFRNIFESRGTTIKYLDASISIEHTREQARNIINSFYQSK